MIKQRVKESKVYFATSLFVVVTTLALGILSGDVALLISAYVNAAMASSVLIAPWRWRDDWVMSLLAALFTPFTLWRQYKTYLNDREEMCAKINLCADQHVLFDQFRCDPNQAPNSISYYQAIIEIMEGHLKRLRRIEALGEKENHP